jgi:hypothetical protein
MSFGEFQSALGGGKPEAVTQLSKDELYKRVGKPDKVQLLEGEALLYYKVKEGTAVIRMERAAYEHDKIRIRPSTSVSLL